MTIWIGCSHHVYRQSFTPLYMGSWVHGSTGPWTYEHLRVPLASLAPCPWALPPPTTPHPEPITCGSRWWHIIGVLQLCHMSLLYLCNVFRCLLHQSDGWLAGCMCGGEGGRGASGDFWYRISNIPQVVKGCIKYTHWNNKLQNVFIPTY